MSDKLNEDVSASQEAQNPANEGTQTDESAVESSKTGAGVENNSESPFKAQLEELEARLKEKEDIIAKKDDAIKVKNRAIKDLKGKTSEEEEGEVDLADKILARLEAKQSQKDFIQQVDSLSADETEKTLVKKLYESGSFQKTGDVQRDIRTAFALANADQLFEQRAYQLQEEGRENAMASLSAATVGRAPSRTSFKSPLQRQAEAIVNAINPAAAKHVSKYTQ